MRAPTLYLLPLLAVAACDTGSGARGDAAAARPVVAATIHPVASIAAAVGGGAVTVRTLLPPGAHPDTYEATPRVAEAVARADLVVRVGGAADGWLDTGAEGRSLVLTEGMRLAGGNPHVWLDPVLVRDSLLPPLVDALARLAPDSADAIRRRGRAYADSLGALDAEIRERLATAPSRRFVAAHPAWHYFARRYDLHEVGSLHPSPGREVGGRELAGLVEEARASGVAAVIAEPQLGRAGTASLGEELRVRVEVADPVGGAGMEGREDYLSLMRYNARAFARALGGGS